MCTRRQQQRTMQEGKWMLKTKQVHQTHSAVIRLKPKDDLLLALQEFVTFNGWGAVYIQACVGSLSKCALRPAGKAEVKTITGDMEIVSMSGTLEVDGSHIHISVADNACNVFGGHMLLGCTVRTTAEVVLGIIDNCTFTRLHDPDSGYQELYLSEH